MSDIKDFKCTYDNSVGISDKVTSKLNLQFPDAYMHSNTMVILAKKIKEVEGATFCALPFCHTVEAESMGGIVNYGNNKIGPRAKEYICTKPQELLELKEIDFSSGRIHELLLACQMLRKEGENVVLEIAGPFTILNVLIDIKYIFKALRKQPELMKEIFWKIGNELLKYIVESQKYGVNMISYADSSGGINILGPKLAEQVVNDFTYDFLKKVSQVITSDTIMLLCPKTTFALLRTGKAEFVDIELPLVMKYSEACSWMIGKEKFMGQMCIKNINYTLENQICKAVRLK